MYAIRLATERLILRAPMKADAARIAHLIGNWKVASMLSRVPYPYAVTDAEDWIARQGGGFVMDRREALAVERLGEGLIGVVGFHEGADGVEFGYWFGEPYWGRGYATEAARVVVDYAFALHDLPQLVAGHFAENERSARVLVKLGFRYAGEGTRWSVARQADVPHRDMRLTQEAWRQRAGLAA